MKFFKNDDGLFDRASKLVTSAGVLFGIWAYFHTIHPVFEKEKELQTLRGESQSLTAQVSQLNTTLVDLEQSKNSLEDNVASLNTQQAKLQEQVAEKEQQLLGVIASLKGASDAAVLNKLQYYSDKLTAAYLLAVTSDKGESFDVLDFSKVLLASHAPDPADEYGNRAYEYFKEYVQSHEGKEIKGNQVVEFAVSLFFNYKIELLRQRVSRI